MNHNIDEQTNNYYKKQYEKLVSIFVPELKKEFHQILYCNGQNKDYTSAVRDRVEHLENNLDDVELAKAVVNRVKMIKIGNHNDTLIYEYGYGDQEDDTTSSIHSVHLYNQNRRNIITNKTKGNVETNSKFKIKKQNHCNITDNQENNHKKRKRYFDFNETKLSKIEMNGEEEEEYRNEINDNDNNILTYYFLDITHKCLILNYEKDKKEEETSDYMKYMNKKKVFPICSSYILDTKGYENFLLLLKKENINEQEEDKNENHPFTLCKDYFMQKKCENGKNCNQIHLDIDYFHEMIKPSLLSHENVSCI